MTLKIFGKKFNITQLAIIAVSLVLILHLFGGCCNCKEGMQIIGSELGYKMGKDVHGSWENKEFEKGPSLEHRQQNHDAYDSKFIGPDQGLNFFGQTSFAPECCSSNYSSKGGITDTGTTSGGCACMNKQQIDYINTRGGNRTTGGDF